MSAELFYWVQAYLERDEEMLFLLKRCGTNGTPSTKNPIYMTITEAREKHRAEVCLSDCREFQLKVESDKTSVKLNHCGPVIFSPISLVFV